MFEVKDIAKKYRNKHVLQGVSVNIRPGTCVGILGENGCGKTTLISILAGILKPTGGEFLKDGRNLLKDDRLRRRAVGYVPQGTPLLDELTAYDNLLIWYDGDRKSLNKDLEKGIPADLGVREFLKVPVSKMSGGMRKRLSIACATSHNPELLLLDEPCAALDLICKDTILEYLSRHKERNGSILLVSHDPKEIELCDEIFILKNGILHPYDYNGNLHSLAMALKSSHM